MIQFFSGKMSDDKIYDIKKTLIRQTVKHN
jgi:hypothetical protein